MSETARKDHVKRSGEFKPTVSSFYPLPKSVGKKPGTKIRKRKNEEPLFTEDRVTIDTTPPPKVTLKKKSNGGYSSSLTLKEIDFELLDPKRKPKKEITLRLKSSHKQVKT